MCAPNTQFAKMMAGGADSQLTVKTDDPKKYGVDTTPPPAPDLTDELIKKARTAELAKLLSTRGRRSTFLGPTGGGGMSPAGSKSTALGGY